MKAKKMFCVVAYDVADDKRRSRLVKVIEKYGTRINYSVFECLFTAAQYIRLQEKIEKLIDRKEDKVVCYPICVDCFTKIKYFPEKRNSVSPIITV